MFLKDFKKTAIIFRDEKISYKNLIDSAKKYTSLIGMRKECKVAIFSENRPEWLYSFFATWNLQGANVLIDYLAIAEEVNYILNDSKPDIIFTSKNNQPILEEALKGLDFYPKIYVYEDINEKDFTGKEEVYEIDRDKLGVLIYTSGTTGQPKGVMLTMNNLLSEIESINTMSIIDETEKVLLLLPMHHAYPLTATMLVPVTNGGTIVFVERLVASEILGLMTKYKVNIIVAVPRLFELFHKSIVGKIKANFFANILFEFSKLFCNLKLGKLLFKKVHNAFGGNVNFFISGGAKLDKEIYRDYWALGFKMSEGYGLSETSPIISVAGKHEKIKIGSVGRPIKDVEVKIVDGEIAVKGDIVMKGYYNKPEETAAVLKDGWFYTGDTGVIDEEGFLFITGRKKDIIVLSNGKNINPEEIEKKILSRTNIIKEICVIEKNNHLHAVIYPDFENVRKENVVNISETIKWKILDKYNVSAPNYKKIANFTILQREFPKTRLGKIRRFQVLDLLNEPEKEKKHEKEPETEEYRIISKYVSDISSRDVFPEYHIELDLGFDSLDKVELLYFIEKTFGLVISNDELLDYMVVKELAAYVSENKKKSSVTDPNWKEILEKNNEEYEKTSGRFLGIGKILLNPMLRGYFNIKLNGLENVPSGPVIFASNHESFVDAFILYNLMPWKLAKDMHVIAKVDHYKSRFRKFIARNTNTMVVDINRNTQDALILASNVLKDNKSVLIFPEGARSRDGKLGNFKKSFAILSKEKNVPVIPIVINGAFEAFPVDKRLPKRGSIEVEFLPAIYPGEKSYNQIKDEVYKEIKSKIK